MRLWNSSILDFMVCVRACVLSEVMQSSWQGINTTPCEVTGEQVCLSGDELLWFELINIPSISLGRLKE